MSVTTEIQRLQTCVENAYTACANKGATMPVTQNSNALTSTIQSINSVVRDQNEIVKYDLEDYDAQTDELTARQADVTLTGKFTDIDEIADNGFNGAFKTIESQRNGITYLPRRKIHGDVIFTKLKKISGVFADVFYSCEFDQGAIVSFPSLTQVIGSSGWWASNSNTSFIQTFQNTKNIGTISFGALQTLDFSMYNTFSGSDASQILFPSLQTVTSTGAFMYNAFRQCLNLTSMSFPALTTISNNDVFYKAGTIDPASESAFYNTPNLEAIHFRADMQTRVENLSGYSSGFGSTNATIYFDL